MPAQLVIMGSGETAPTMVKAHRTVFEQLPADASLVALDSTYGFQVNADDLSHRTWDYFRESLGRDVQVLRWRREQRDARDEAAVLAAVRRADWVFAGPGSPSYALSSWLDTPMADTLAELPGRGRVLLLASAAAVAAGELAVPVYEIYKAGLAPSWMPALDVLGRTLGLRSVVIPHWNNAEGGTYDTRFCYLGAERLHRMEAELPSGVSVIGVDEHTALVVDLETRTVRVLGKGTVTVRLDGNDVAVLAAGSEHPVEVLSGAGGAGGQATSAGVAATSATADGHGDTDRGEADGVRESGETAQWADAASLREATDSLDDSFARAVQDRAPEEAAGALLELEQAVHVWSLDSTQSDDVDHARVVLRGMVAGLADLAAAGATPLERIVAPWVDLLLHLRERARDARDWTTADLVRDGLLERGVEVKDTPDGTVWQLKD
ncbi:MAG: CysS/YqeB C-terminal domain-containing protein [Actinomycetales bacterium]